jgi:hypothetical protein
MRLSAHTATQRERGSSGDRRPCPGALSLRCTSAYSPRYGIPFPAFQVLSWWTFAFYTILLPMTPSSIPYSLPTERESHRSFLVPWLHIPFVRGHVAMFRTVVRSGSTARSPTSPKPGLPCFVCSPPPSKGRIKWLLTASLRSGSCFHPRFIHRTDPVRSIGASRRKFYVLSSLRQAARTFSRRKSPR